MLGTSVLHCLGSTLFFWPSLYTCSRMRRTSAHWGTLMIEATKIVFELDDARRVLATGS